MQNLDRKLEVVRVNSILNNSEGKILQKFCEALNLKAAGKNYTIEMIEMVQKFFDDQKGICLLFILEDIDFYIENTKQMMLYKILDMLQYAKIPFVFVATSQKVDIVDSFEKRIKSRFSHRQVLFYEEKLEDFILAIEIQFLKKYMQPILNQLENIKERKLENEEIDPSFEVDIEDKKTALDKI